MKCPICNSEMHQQGIIGETDDGLPSYVIESNPSEKSIHFYQCEQCRLHEITPFAYQRTFVKGKWYIFNWCKWNLLKEEFNPSRRETINVLDRI